MDIARLASLMDLKSHYDRLGLYDPADYEAAGFTQAELDDSGLFTMSPGVVPGGDGSEVSPQAYPEKPSGMFGWLQPDDTTPKARYSSPLMAQLVQEYGSTVGLPTNAKLYTRAMAGDETPVQDTDFTVEELRAIASLADSAQQRGSAQVTYEDYPKSSLGNIVVGEMPNDDAISSIMTSLGQFSAQPTTEGYRVTDTYNFNPQSESRGLGTPSPFFPVGTGSLSNALYAAGELSPYGVMRSLGEAYGPRNGAGMPIEFLVPYPKRSGK